MNRLDIKCCLDKTIIISAYIVAIDLLNMGTLLLRKLSNTKHFHLHSLQHSHWILFTINIIFVVFLGKPKPPTCTNSRHNIIPAENKIIRIGWNTFLKYIENELNFSFRKLTFEQKSFQTVIKIP